MEILTQPSAYNFAGNIPDFIISSTEQVPFKLYRGLGPGIGSGSDSGTGGIPGEDDLLLDETYTPDADGLLTVELREYLESILSTALPGAEVALYDQTTAYCQLTALIGSGLDQEEVTFYVIKGGVDAITNDAAFLAGNFLTWQESVKYVTQSDPEWISYFAQQAVQVWIKAYFDDNTNETIALQSLSADKLYSINTKFSLLSENFEDDPVKIEVWISEADEGSGSGSGIPGTTLSRVQTYQLSEEHFVNDDIFVFANSLGGIDCIRFVGQLKKSENFLLDSALFDRDTLEYKALPDRRYSKNTGDFRSNRHLLWARDFFASLLKYRWVNSNFHRVITDRMDLDSIARNLNSYEFTFQESRQTLYQDYIEMLGAPNPPTAPSGLAATPVSSTEIDLSWTDNSDDETGFILQRSTDSDFTSPVEIELAADTTWYPDTDLEISTTYYYRIKAISNSGSSDWSETVSATTIGYFTSVWKTDNPGFTNDDQIRLPLVSGGTYDFIVYNDANDDVLLTCNDYTNNTITFADGAGTYTLRIEGTIEGWRFSGSVDPEKILDVSACGQLSFGDTDEQFKGCINLEWTATDAPDLSSTTSLANCFKSTSLSTTASLNNWDISGILGITGMFYDSSFNGTINLWDVAACTGFNNLFRNNTVFNQDISDWDTSSLLYATNTFDGATSFNQDISGWDMSNVTTLENAFKDASAFNADISGWDVSSCDDFSKMFWGATAFNQDISGWNVSLCDNFYYMFFGATSFNQDISGWNMANATTIEQMFNGATSFAYSLDDWDVSGVTNMIGVFANTTYNQDITSWDTGVVTSMASMFFANSAFNQDISGWDTSAVESMLSMFYQASAFNQDISGWDVSSCALFTTMFYQATSFNQDIGGWTTTALTSTNGMFNSATSFDQDLGSWDVTGLTDAANMFYGVTLSTANCNALLVGWEAQSLQNTVTLNLGSSEYDFGSPAIARAAIIADHSWTITDGGEAAWPGCVAYFRMDEASGAIVEAVNGNDGTVNGTTQNVTGYIGKAHSSDGANDFDDLSSIISLLESNSVGTIATWIKPVDATPVGYEVILSISDASAETIFNVYVNPSNGYLSAVLTLSGTNYWNMKTSYAPFSDDTWSHLFLVKTEASVEVYVDNSLITMPFTSEVDKTKWLTDATGLDTVLLSAQRYNGNAVGEFYEGLQDEVSFFNRILTADEREYVMNNSYPT